MNVLISLALAALIASSVTGCVIVGSEQGDGREDWEDEQTENRNVISRLELGSSRTDVVSKLGTPSFSEAYTHGAEEVRVLFFRTRHRHSDGATTRDETTPLVFKNDRLVGWGEDSYQSLR